MKITIKQLKKNNSFLDYVSKILLFVLALNTIVGIIVFTICFILKITKAT